jgi:hypothetical protein
VLAEQLAEPSEVVEQVLPAVRLIDPLSHVGWQAVEVGQVGQHDPDDQLTGQVPGPVADVKRSESGQVTGCDVIAEIMNPAVECSISRHDISLCMTILAVAISVCAMILEAGQRCADVHEHERILLQC